MHRFFLPPELIHDTSVDFPPETAHQIRQVLRLGIGAKVIALDGQGAEYLVQLNRVEREGVNGQILDQRTSSSEPHAQISLYICLAQREKFEWTLQKCTEAGAGRFVPVISHRSLVQEKQNSQSKLPRWQKIVREAAEQCGRGRIPPVEMPCSFTNALQEIQSRYSTGLILWEKENEMGISAGLRILQAQFQAVHTRPLDELAVLIGPEGGFDEQEIQHARAAGLVSVSLGRRILRMETAALAAVLLILHDLGEDHPA